MAKKTTMYACACGAPPLLARELGEHDGHGGCTPLDPDAGDDATGSDETVAGSPAAILRAAGVSAARGRQALAERFPESQYTPRAREKLRRIVRALEKLADGAHAAIKSTDPRVASDRILSVRQDLRSLARATRVVSPSKRETKKILSKMADGKTLEEDITVVVGRVAAIVEAVDLSLCKLDTALTRRWIESADATAPSGAAFAGSTGRRGDGSQFIGIGNLREAAAELRAMLGTKAKGHGKDLRRRALILAVQDLGVPDEKVHTVAAALLATAGAETWGKHLVEAIRKMRERMEADSRERTEELARAEVRDLGVSEAQLQEAARALVKEFEAGDGPWMRKVDAAREERLARAQQARIARLDMSSGATDAIPSRS